MHVPAADGGAALGEDADGQDGGCEGEEGGDELHRGCGCGGF